MFSIMSVEAAYFVCCFPIWSPSKVFHNRFFTCSMCFSVHNTFINRNWIFWTHTGCTRSGTSPCCTLISTSKLRTQPLEVRFYRVRRPPWKPMSPNRVAPSNWRPDSLFYLLTNPKVAKHLCKSPIWENDWNDFSHSPCWIRMTSHLREMTHLFSSVREPPKSKLFRIFCQSEVCLVELGDTFFSCTHFIVMLRTADVYRLRLMPHSSLEYVLMLQYL